MKNKLYPSIMIGLLSLVGLSLTQCNDSSFATSGGTKNSGTTASTPTTSSPGGTDVQNIAKGTGTTPGTNGTTPGTTGTNPNGGSCVPTPGGKGAFKFPAAIQACMDSGKIYDFANSRCTSVGSNTSYNCDFDSFIKASAATLQGGAPPEIAAAKAAGAILIACGENANMVMAQWFTPSAGQDLSSCNFTQFNAAVMNVCYRYYPNGGQPAPATTAAEEQAQVLACLYYPNAGP